MSIYEQNPMGTVLANAPGMISQALQSRKQNQMNQQQMMMNMQQMQQAQMQLEVQKKQMGMDRGGYGNQALSEYFSQLMMAPGSLVSDPVSGNFVWSMDQAHKMPTQQEAWAQYQAIVGPGNITSADTDYFMGTLWPKLMETRAGLVVSEIQKLEKAGYSEKDMRLIMANNPTLFADLSVVMPYVQNAAPEISAKMAGYMPQKPVSFGAQMSDVAPYLGPAAIGGTAGYNWMQGTAQEYIDAAQSKYESKLQRRSINPETRSTKKLNELKKKLDKLNKSNPRTEQGWKSRATKIKNVTSKITGEKSKIDRVFSVAKKYKDADIAKNTRWARTMAYMPKNYLNFPVAAVAPAVGGTVGGFLGGDKGEAIGSGLGGGVQAAYGTAKGVSLANWLMQKGFGIGSRKLAQGGLMASLDGPLPFGDILGAAWGLGSGSYEMYNAIKEWRAANQSY